jgi:hypothetical protein
LTEGRKELAALRANNGQDVVNLKDERIEKDRIDMNQALVKQQYEAKQVADAKQESIKEERKQQMAASNGQIVDSTFAPSTGLGAAGVALAGAFGIAQASNEEQDYSDKKNSVPKNPTLVAALEPPPPPPTPPGTSLLYAAPLPTILPTVKEDAREKAQRVMDEYMNQDDGGDAWLASLTEIIDTEE